MTKRVIEVDRPIEEMVKGSLEYASEEVRTAFFKQFRPNYGDEAATRWYPTETFPDFLIVRKAGGEDKPDEFYRAPYSRNTEGEIVFPPPDEWEPIELAYRPRTEPGAPPPEPVVTPTEPADDMGDSQESQGGAPPVAPPRSSRGGKALNEDNIGGLTLIESAAGPKKLKAIGITAGVVNGNRRRYSAEVLRAAVADLRLHLHESAGQGRAVQLLGEAEHPESKARRPSVREVVVKWDDARFNEQTKQVELDGHLIETAAGRDIRALLEGGVMPGVSQRARGRSRFVEEAGERIEEVTELTITGYDLVMEPSDPFAGVTLTEEEQDGADDAPPAEEETMTPEQLAEMLRAQPELVTELVAEQVKALTEAQVAAATEKIVAEQSAATESARAEAQQAQAQLVEMQRAQAVAAALTEQTADLPYGAARNQLFVEAVRAAPPATVEDVTALVTAKRAEYDAVLAAEKLRGMGMDVQVVGPVIETQTGGDWPEYAKVSFELTENLKERGLVEAWSPNKPRNRNQTVAAQMLKRFDAVNKTHLLRESKLFDEAETAAGLSLPYSTSRAILASVWPTLVATGLFDVGVTENAPLYIQYEVWGDESGKYVAVTDEDVVADLDTWVSLAHKRLRTGTVVVAPNGGGAAYAEGTDYIVDHGNGALMALSTGTMADGVTYDVDYGYDAIREGEGSAIQESKYTLARALMDIQADRLATSITHEAIVFSRSQLGWDATARTLAGLINEIRRRIDANIMDLALQNALAVANNIGGTWTSASDPIIDFVSHMGVAKDKLLKRYYRPAGILMSTTVADRVAKWEGFTFAGQRPDATIDANGYLGRVNGLPVFQSTEFTDAYALVFDREHLFHRVYEPMTLNGPFQAQSNGKMVDTQQWFVREMNGTLVPLRNKASCVKIV